jgi:hypothetical protein
MGAPEGRVIPVVEQPDFDDNPLESLVRHLSVLREVDPAAIYLRGGPQIQVGHPVLVGVIELFALAPADYFHCLTPDRDGLGAAVAVIWLALFAPVSWRYRSHDNA